VIENKEKGFTLVELLAVIVILAIILVIAVPQIMNVIKDTTKASLESSAKMVASQVENQYTVAQTLGKEFASTGTCMEEWSGLNTNDYESCTYKIDSDGNATIKLIGKGKFKDLNVCIGTRSSATANEGVCITPAVSFEEDDWETIISAVKSGNYPYEVGETKLIDLGSELGVHTLRVANTTPCSEVTVESQTACGFVLEFADIITNMSMNDTERNEGGWKLSNLKTYVNETIYNAIPEELRNGIINTYVVSSHGCLDNANYDSTDKLYLLSAEEVYGISVYNYYDSSYGTSRQLDYYANNNVSVSSNKGTIDNYEEAIKVYGEEVNYEWWLRSAKSYFSEYYEFYGVKSYGRFVEFAADNENVGVSPAFRLAE